jgi:hypothetical protein
MIVATVLLIFTAAPPALADPVCGDGTNFYYQHVGAKSVIANYDLIRSTITDPSASTIPGTHDNNYYYDHILLWDDIHEDSLPSTQDSCGTGVKSACWLQAGVGMGFVGIIGGTHALTPSKTYLPYMEDYGANGTDGIYHVYFYPNISINQDSAVPVEVFYTGLSGSGGNPQFEADLQDTSGVWNDLGHGYMYYPAGHAKAIAEVENYQSTSCPTLTLGSPYQNFGTNAAGNIVSGDKITLRNPSGTGPWTGSPETFGLSGPHYWLTDTLSDWPASFRSNGPAGGPP